MPDSFIMRISSCVVMTTSTFGAPSVWNSPRAASNFLAVQGMTATWNVFLPRERSSALSTEANISIGERQVEMFLSSSGCFFSQYCTQPGQQEVMSGRFSPLSRRSSSSLLSSSTVRSAPSEVS